MSQSSYDTHSSWGTSYPSTPTAPAPAPYAAAPYAPVPYPVAAAAETAPLNPLAMASLMTSVFGLGLVAVVLGHVALNLIKRNNERGGALAIVGMILGYLQLALVAVVIVLAVLDGSI
jgi:hypothetical protein